MTGYATAPAHTTFSPDSLLDFGMRALDQAGFTPEGARTVAETLVEGDLRGVHTHGIGFLPRYIRGVIAGHINPRPEVAPAGGRGAVQMLDGDNGLGHIAARVGMDNAIEAAREHGVGIVGVRNSNHFGVAARYAEMASSADMIGFVTTNGPAVLAPWGGRTPTFCNNPIAWAVPAGRHPAIVLDMACSVVARGKILLAAQLGQDIPEGWALDAEGHPTTDAAAALGGIVLPLGEYKGYGIAVINECLAGALTGALMTLEVSRHTVTSGAYKQVQDAWRIGHFLMAVDVTAFMPLEEFKQRVDKVIDDIKASDLAADAECIYLPGEIEHGLKAARKREGIPLAAGTVAQLQEFATDQNLEWPAGISSGG